MGSTSSKKGTSGSDILIGTAGNDHLSGKKGNDLILGLGGKDRLKGGKGNDVLDGGAGSDDVRGESGNDLLIYSVLRNFCGADRYDGGSGLDTLRLDFTRSEWLRSDVQSDIGAYLQFLSQHVKGSGEATGQSFHFKAFDLTASKIEILQVTVDGVSMDPRDQAVRAVADSARVGEDGTVSGNVLVNDTVPDLVKALQLVSGPAHGALTLRADGSSSYTPGSFFNSLAAGKTATESFTYRVTDADGDTATATATITIVGANDAPRAVNDTAATNEDTAISINVRANDTDVDGDALTLAGLSGTTSALGAAISIVNGQVLYDPRGSSFLQALGNAQSVTDSFSYTIRDPSGATSTATAQVTVAGASDGGFLGKTIDYTYVFPTRTSIYFNRDVTVTSGVELPGITSAGADYATLDIRNDGILVDFTAAGQWSPAEFNGFRIFDEFGTVPAITGVQIVQNNMAGFSAANVSFDANTITVNWQGLSFTPQTLVDLQVSF